MHDALRGCTVLQYIWYLNVDRLKINWCCTQLTMVVPVLCVFFSNNQDRSSCVLQRESLLPKCKLFDLLNLTISIHHPEWRWSPCQVKIKKDFNFVTLKSKGKLCYILTSCAKKSCRSCWESELVFRMINTLLKAKYSTSEVYIHLLSLPGCFRVISTLYRFANNMNAFIGLRAHEFAFFLLLTRSFRLTTCSVDSSFFLYSTCSSFLWRISILNQLKLFWKHIRANVALTMLYHGLTFAMLLKACAAESKSKRTDLFKEKQFQFLLCTQQLKAT